MPLDFPANPVNGQIFTAGSASWQWDGTKWVPAAGQSAFPDAPSDGNTYGRRNAAWNSVDAMLAPVSANANGALNNAGRNLIHNAQFNIAQRGAGPFTTFNSYTVDRWITAGVTDTISIGNPNLSDSDRAGIGDESARSALQNTFTGNAAAGAYNEIQHRIEDARRLSGKTITASFWANPSTVGLKLGINILQRMGTGGSPSADVSALTTGIAITLGAGWARYTATIALPSLSGKTLGTNGDSGTWLRIAFSSGATANAYFGNIGVQSGTVLIWGVQLEIGGVATPLAKRDPADELALCQRFYQGGTFVLYQSSAAASQTVAAPISLTVAMRAGPTVTFQQTASNLLTSQGFSATSNTSLQWTATTTAVGGYAYSANWQASADL